MSRSQRIQRFRTVTFVWIHLWLWNYALSLKQHRRCALLFFKVIRQMSRSHRAINHRFWPELCVSGQTMNLVWIHRWLWNDAQSLKQYKRGVLLFFKVIRQILRSHGTQNHRFWPELSFSGLELQFEFTDGFEIMQKAKCSPEEVPILFFEVIHQILRLHGTKYCRFWPDLSVSGQELQVEFTDGLKMMHKAGCNVKEVPYNFSRSSIKFQGHTGWKIDDLNPIWVRLLSRSQLTNPSDLPCCIHIDATIHTKSCLLSFLHCKQTRSVRRLLMPWYLRR